MLHAEQGSRRDQMSDELAMVTGASSGIGEAFARELVRRGFPVILVARRLDRLSSLRDEFGVQTDVLVADLATEEGIAAVARRLQLGGISLLVNNAGVGYRGRLVDQRDANITQLVRVNLEAPMRLSRAALGPMTTKGRGIIINVVSMGAFQPVPYLNVYAATKAGLLSFTEALADEVAGSGVRIQALCPGNIPTGFQEVAGTKGSRFDRTPSMSAPEVARGSLDAAFRGGGTLFLPARLDRVSVFAQRFLPRFVARRIAGSLLKQD
jgi:short-subunit dehydrogenase